MLGGPQHSPAWGLAIQGDGVWGSAESPAAPEEGSLGRVRCVGNWLSFLYQGTTPGTQAGRLHLASPAWISQPSEMDRAYKQHRSQKDPPAAVGRGRVAVAAWFWMDQRWACPGEKVPRLFQPCSCPAASKGQVPSGLPLPRVPSGLWPALAPCRGPQGHHFPPRN